MELDGAHDEFFDAFGSLSEPDGLLIDVSTKDLAFLDELSPFGDGDADGKEQDLQDDVHSSTSVSGNDDHKKIRIGNSLIDSSSSSNSGVSVNNNNNNNNNKSMPVNNSSSMMNFNKTKMIGQSNYSLRKPAVSTNAAILDNSSNCYLTPSKMNTYALPMATTAPAFVVPRSSPINARQTNSPRGSNLSKTGRRKSSEYRGVSFNYKSQKWKSVITVNKVQKFLGYFDTEVEAAKKYDEASKKWRGNQGRLNFPDGIIPQPTREAVIMGKSAPQLHPSTKLVPPPPVVKPMSSKPYPGTSFLSIGSSKPSMTKIQPRHPYDFGGPPGAFDEIPQFSQNFSVDGPSSLDNFAAVFPSPYISPFSSPMTSPRMPSNNNYESLQKDVFSKMHYDDDVRNSSINPSNSSVNSTKRRPNLELQIPPDAAGVMDDDAGSDYGSPRKKQRPTPSQASQNASASKCSGVSYCKVAGRYRVDITVNGMRSCMGYFDSEDEANRAYSKFATSTPNLDKPSRHPSDDNLSPKTADLVRKSRNLNIATPTSSFF